MRLVMVDKEINHIDLRVPDSWNTMTQDQLRFFFLMLNVEDSMESVKTRCFLKWSGINVVGKNKRSGQFLLRKGRHFFSASSDDVWQWMKCLEYLDSIPKLPAVLTSYDGHISVDPLFKDVSFGTYLSCVAVWSDMVKSPNIDVEKFRRLISYLYGFIPRKIRYEFVGCVIFWMSSIQEFFSRKFSDLFAPVNSDGQGSLGSASSSFQKSMDAMIRALTKGDVLKEKDVLNVDVWRALTELNAIAAESKHIKDSLK